jgi:hypothetical protein
LPGLAAVAIEVARSAASRTVPRANLVLMENSPDDLCERVGEGLCAAAAGG